MINIKSFYVRPWIRILAGILFLGIGCLLIISFRHESQPTHGPWEDYAPANANVTQDFQPVQEVQLIPVEESKPGIFDQIEDFIPGAVFLLLGILLLLSNPTFNLEVQQKQLQGAFYSPDIFWALC